MIHLRRFRRPIALLTLIAHLSTTIARAYPDSLTKAAQTLAGYTYTLGASGNRTGVAEVGGRTRSYTYDNLYRLTGETISGSPLSGAIAYVYDAVGNRTTRSSTVPTVAPATHTYSNNDWLNSDTYDNTQQSAAITYTVSVRSSTPSNFMHNH